LGALLGGGVVTERGLNVQGWGTVLVNGVINYDSPLGQTMIVLGAGLVIVANLVTTLLCGWLDPRSRSP
jgi:ABC-type dipeptide/oligopeptide/nickel transport system permease component